MDVEALARAALAHGHDQAAADALAAGIRAEVRRDSANAWRRFAPHIQAVLGDQGGALETTIVASLCFVLAGEPALVDVEPRFLDLAARVRAHPRIGEWARAVLAAIPRDQAIAAIERYPRRGPRVTRGPLPAARDYLTRYRAGEAVWDEVVAHAPAVSLHPDLRDEVCAVADEMMGRLPARARPVGEIDRLVALAGPLPIAIEACLRVANGTGITPEIGRVLDEYEHRIARSHREIVGPLALPLEAGGSVDLPPATVADAVDPVVHPLGARFVTVLRQRFAL